MTVSRRDVEDVAELAAIALDETDIDALVTQLEKILDFVAQLEDVEEQAADGVFRPGPEAAPLREDVVSPIPMSTGVERLAPDFRDGFILVPRIESLGDDA